MVPSGQATLYQEHIVQQQCLEVIKLVFTLKLKISRDDWLLADSNQSLRVILSLRLYSSFITSRSALSSQ